MVTSIVAIDRPRVRFAVDANFFFGYSSFIFTCFWCLEYAVTVELDDIFIWRRWMLIFHNNRYFTRDGNPKNLDTPAHLPVRVVKRCNGKRRLLSASWDQDGLYPSISTQLREAHTSYAFCSVHPRTRLAVFAVTSNLPLVARKVIQVRPIWKPNPRVSGRGFTSPEKKIVCRKDWFLSVDN